MGLPTTYSYLFASEPGLTGHRNFFLLELVAILNNSLINFTGTSEELLSAEYYLM